MDGTSLTSDQSETKLKDNTRGEKTQRRSKSTWKRTKRLLTCSSCHGNGSDSEAYGPSTLTTLDVPLCSGDKRVDLAMMNTPAIIEHKRADDIFFDSEENFEKIVLNHMNFSKEFEEAVNDWLSDTSELFGTSVSEILGIEEGGKVDMPIKNNECLPLQERGGIAMIEDSVHVNERNEIENKDVLVSFHEVENIAQEDANNSKVVDQSAAVEEPCEICKAEELRCASSEAPAPRDEAENAKHEVEIRDLPEKTDVKISDELAKKIQKQEISAVIKEPSTDVSDISKEEQDGVSSEVPSIDSDLVPAKQLAIPRRYVLGTGEAHVLPDAEDVDVAAGSATESGEGPVQEFLQEVISERELIAIRVEVIDDLLAREWHTGNPTDAPLMVTNLANETSGSNLFTGLPSLEAMESICSLDQADVLALDLPSQEMTLQTQGNEDIASRSLTDTDCVTELTPQDAVLEDHECVSIISENDSVELTEKTEKLAKEVATECLVTVKESTHQLSVEAEEVPVMNVFYEELVQDVVNIAPEVLKGDIEIDTVAVEIQVEEQAATLDSARTFIPCGYAENIPSAISAENYCNVLTEVNDESTDKEDVKSTADVEAEYKDDQTLPSLTACSSKRLGSNLQLPLELTQVDSQEIIYPKRVKVVHAHHHLHSERASSVASLTDAVADSCERLPGNELDTLLTVLNVTGVALEDLGEASRGCLKPTLSVSDLDALLSALETTESTLANLEVASLGCLQSISSDKDRTTSQVEGDSTLSEEEEKGCPNFELFPVDKNLATFHEADTSLVTIDSCSSNESVTSKAVEGITKRLSLNISQSLATFDTRSVEPSSQLPNQESLMMSKEEPSIGYLESTSTDKSSSISLKEADITIADVDGEVCDILEPWSMTDNLKTLGDMEPLLPLSETQMTIDSSRSNESITLKVAEEKTNELFLNISQSLAAIDSGSAQPSSSGNDHGVSPTQLATESLIDQEADNAISSLIELTRKPDLEDLLPTTSLMCLALPSDDSIADLTSSTSTEETGVESMAVASTSAEWPDQGKEQHRVARNNNKRNKKRNRRNKK